MQYFDKRIDTKVNLDCC